MSSQEPFSRAGVIAAVRLFSGLFFLGVSAYSLLSYSPFAYGQFIKPNVVPALTDFVIVSPWLFWVAFLLTLLTLVPQLRGGRGKALAIAYLAVWGAVGVAVLVKPPLLSIGNTWRGLVVGLVALVPPVWLAVLDHVAQPAPAVAATDRARALAACGWAAAAAFTTYALAVPLRLRQVVGIELSGNALAVALGSAFVLDLFVFMTLFLALAAVMGAAAFSRARPRVEYWLFMTLLAACSALVVYFLICASITFVGRDAAIASAALGATFAALWADLARLRIQRPSARALDALDMFSAPIAGRRSRVAAGAVLVVLPIVAYGLADAVSHFDWSFLLQKLGVLLVWLATFTAAYAATADSPRARRYSLPAIVAPLVAFGLYQGLFWLDPRVVLDRYAAVDPSFRLIRDARTARSAETAEYYTYLQANTLLPSSRIPRTDLDLVPELPPAHGRKPLIFLLIVDSLRRDYLSPYNSAVDFTPRIGELAADSFVFDRAFTRYAGTALAVPSIWSGGMMLHSLDQPAFGRRNTLLKLLDANGYTRMMDLDHIIQDLVPNDPNLRQLDVGKGTMQFDVCTTMKEVTANLAAGDRSRPVFFYSLPQNVHISMASQRAVPSGESYPGFFAPVASSVRRLDGCFGAFVDDLKRANLYDDSIIIVTSDHGDSLGEEGRWGHAHFIIPEVMRIPLIIHLPSWMKSRVSADLGALTFSTDITPSLYALLGYEPADLGSFFGRPLFVSPDADTSWRRRERFLLASSYGTVYGTLRHNGRRLFVVDAIDGRDTAFDIGTTFVGQRLEITQAMIADNRGLIREELTALALRYRYPAP